MKTKKNLISVVSGVALVLISLQSQSAIVGGPSYELTSWSYAGKGGWYDESYNGTGGSMESFPYSGTFYADTEIYMTYGLLLVILMLMPKTKLQLIQT